MSLEAGRIASRILTRAKRGCCMNICTQQVWSQARNHEFVALTVARQRVSLEWEVVQTIERVSGRKARPFELDIRVLPVAAVQAWRLSPKRALVSRALFRDRAAYREWLRPVIEELA